MDFNLPNIDWATLQVEGIQYPHHVNQLFVDMTADTGLEQMVTFPTRKDKTFDVITPSHQSFVYGKMQASAFYRE